MFTHAVQIIRFYKKEYENTDWDHMPVRGLGLKSKWRTNLRTIAFKEKSAFDDLELIPMEPLIDSGRSILCKFVFRRENDRLKPTIMKIFLKL